MTEFVDYRWNALNGPTEDRDPRMIGYWKGLSNNHISKEKGELFLNKVWISCAPEDEFSGERHFYDEQKKEEELWQKIQLFRDTYKHLPDWLELSGTFKTSIPPEIKIAFSSRKRSKLGEKKIRRLFALERGKSLVLMARNIFGKPLYECVSIAVSVAVGIEISGDDLKKSFASQNTKINHQG
ncbi:hypothetical protein RGU70_17340 [Herbaspirillum sp. RTI4]|uniref:hypothetical protein n=1 Tax=Herbaspirillum sp. RTI4 TaxID=3048640 RepID=UPI002AB442AA|nr:hypothetical protein [Herbaspirillum sp. RTI4]MDY7580077.1 hypothetical protein [Herbaspirillum sp. RTI4]MEA9983304.1 hypothetical protein [Herbaspirillum sp. RTI4]